MRPQSKLNLEFVDIRSILEHLQIPFTSKGKNVSRGWIGTQCPFPGCDDRTNHCGLCLTSPVVSCFSCGTSGNYLSYLASLLKSWNKAIELIEQFTPRELRSNKLIFPSEKAISVELPKGVTKNPSTYQRKYIEGRGYKLKELEQLYDFWYCGPFGEWKNRIIVPIYYRNRLVTFTSIDIAEKSKLRYRHLSEEKSIYHCKEILYGMEFMSSFEIVGVVEGFFDRARIGQNCVCTFGTLVTQAQFQLLTQFRKVIIIFDGDRAGYDNSRKLADNLSAFVTVERLKLSSKSDPDTLTSQDVRAIQNSLKTKIF